MRVKVIFKNSKIRIPLKAHKHIFQGMFYKKLGKVGDILHDIGFKKDKKNFTMFTFSNIFCKKMFIENDTMVCIGPLQVFFSSPIDAILNELVSNLYSSCSMINNHKLDVIEVSIEETGANTDKFYVKTLSPIVAYKKEGEIRYASPYEEEFANSVRDNLMTKYSLLYKEDGFPFSIKPHEVKKKVIYYKGVPIEAWHGLFEVETSRNHFNKILDAGLGARNSQGFGMIEVVGGA